jgi:hypothetical protein
MFVEYQKIDESSFDKFITGNFVDLSDLDKQSVTIHFFQCCLGWESNYLYSVGRGVRIPVHAIHHEVLRQEIRKIR